jgi:glutathione S-transferase
MSIAITAFERSPDGGKGLARDTRARWALEEEGQPYEVRLVSFRAMKEPAHLALHPFGQIPTYEEGDLALFETGAIVFHIAEHHGGLLPKDANARARAITWMFAALNTVEPPILELATARLLEGDKPWSSACRWSRVVSAPGWNNFPLAWAMPTGSMARSARATC